MRIDPFTLQRLRDLPIEQVAERVGLHVERHKSLCPFHDDHRPSLTFHARSNTFRCFSCGARGGPIDLVMRRLGMTFPEACRWLDGGVRIDPLPLSRPRPREEAYKPFDAARYARFFEHPWLSDPARQFLFQERRLDPRVAAWCRLTSWTDRHGTHWLQTPYYDTNMRLVGLQNRNLDYKKSAVAEAQTTSRATSAMVSQADARIDSRTDARATSVMVSQTDARIDSRTDARATSTIVSQADARIDSRTDARATSEKENRTTSGMVCESTSGGPAQANSVSHMAPATALSSEAIAQPRFRFPQGSRCGLYNQPVLLRLRPGEPLYITEGCSDCWAMLSSGRKAVAIPSATTLHDAEVRLLLDLHDRLATPFHMCPDADAPGERLFLQLRDLLPDLVHHHLPPGCKDFSDYYLSITKNKKSS